MTIVLKKEENNLFYAYIDGVKKPTEFVSVSDFREWLGCMNAHGYYLGASAYISSLTGALTPVTPTYEYPCNDPQIFFTR